MTKITFKYGDQVKEVDAEKGEKLLKVGLDAGVPIEYACGGNGFCTTCMVKVTEGMENLSTRSDREENMGVVNGPDRLTCQTTVEGDGDVVVEVTV